MESVRCRVWDTRVPVLMTYIEGCKDVIPIEFKVKNPTLYATNLAISSFPACPTFRKCPRGHPRKPAPQELESSVDVDEVPTRHRGRPRKSVKDDIWSWLFRFRVVGLKNSLRCGVLQCALLQFVKPFTGRLPCCSSNLFYTQMESLSENARIACVSYMHTSTTSWKHRAFPRPCLIPPRRSNEKQLSLLAPYIQLVPSRSRSQFISLGVEYSEKYHHYEVSSHGGRR